jgi:adenosylmethionine-8-amino-7-oxononanoate aminotransferase
MSGTLRRTRLWHPFANMAQVAGAEVVFARGEGVWLFDESGKRYRWRRRCESVS